jgi:enoyl-CoA hydratase
MDYSSYKDLLIEKKDKVLTLTMNRPDAMNASSNEMHDGLSRIFYDIVMDDEVNVVVLTGAGRAFSAGGDVVAQQTKIDEPELFLRTIYEARKIIYGILDCDKPIIARINGHAVGLGCTLALFCDITIAVEQAKIGDPHVSVGLVAGDGGAVIWPQLVGYHRAKEFLFTGDLMSATEAARIGLINHAVAPEELDEKVYGLADRLANGPIKAIRWTKQSINIPLKQLAHSMMDASLNMEALSNLTEDHQRAVSAFAEKRKPSYTGRW